MYDLNLIAKVFERDAADLDKCPSVPDRARKVAAIRQCVSELRKIGWSNDPAVGAIYVACLAYGGK